MAGRCALFLLGWFRVDQRLLPYSSAISLAQGTAETLAIFGSLFVVILGATALTREFAPGYGYLWVRVASLPDYLLAKYLGLCVSIAVTLGPVGVWIAYLVYAMHGWPGVAIQFGVWMLMIAPTLVLVLAMTFALGLLTRRRLWSALLGLVIAYSIPELDLAFLHPANFAPIGVYASALIGYGPDFAAVVWHRLLYLALAFLVIAICAWAMRIVAPRCEPAVPRRAQMAWSMLLSLTVALIAGLTFGLQQARAALTSDLAPAPAVDVAPVCAIIEAYHIQVTLDPQTARLAGKVTLRVPVAAQPLRVPLALNHGLHIEQVEVASGSSARVVDNVLFLDSSSRQPSAITLRYAGTLQYPRNQYDIIVRSLAQSLDPFRTGGYLDRQTTFLIRDGNWHPLPACQPQSLQVDLLQPPLHVVHTADRAKQTADRLTLIWERPPPLPLFTASHRYQIKVLDGALLFLPPQRLAEHAIAEVASPYVAMMAFIEQQLLAQPARLAPYQIAYVPLIRHDYYDPASRVLWLSDTRLEVPLIPEQYLAGTGPLASRDALYRRWIAERMVHLWWCGEGECLLAQPEQSFTQAEPVVMSALISYTALRLAEPLVGSAFVEAELATRQRILAEPAAWVEVWLPHVAMFEVNQLMLHLDALWHEAGSEALWRIAREYRQHYGTDSISVEAFWQFALP